MFNGNMSRQSFVELPRCRGILSRRYKRHLGPLSVFGTAPMFELIKLSFGDPSVRRYLALLGPRFDDK